MSYLAFGSIFIVDFYSNKYDETAQRIVRKGIDLGLFVLLSPNIPQVIVKKMLDEHELGSKPDFQFLITGSPICDTTDSLISPPYFGEEDLRSVYKNLALIAKWIDEIMKYDGIKEVHLYLTEGYDDCFKEMDASTIDLNEMLNAEVREYGDIPSLCLKVIKK
jgi:hypothetical protein